MVEQVHLATISRDLFDSADAEILIVVPPFASADRPSLGASIIAGIARTAGIKANVLYANLSFATLLGANLYQRLCDTPPGLLIGERIFSGAKFGYSDSAAYPGDAGEVGAVLHEICGSQHDPLVWLQGLAADWADKFATLLADSKALIVGFTTVFEQTLAALALAARLKSAAPTKLILLGGANVEGDMAEGVAAIANGVDYIFSGESEDTFRRFLAEYTTSRDVSAPRIIRGTPTSELDAIPSPDYSDYFRQLDATIHRAEGTETLNPNKFGCLTRAVAVAGGDKSITAHFVG